MKGIKRLMRTPVRRHLHTTGCWEEVGLLDDGCKLVRCRETGEERDSHRKIYGCQHPAAL